MAKAYFKCLNCNEIISKDFSVGTVPEAPEICPKCYNNDINKFQREIRGVSVGSVASEEMIALGQKMISERT